MKKAILILAHHNEAFLAMLVERLIHIDFDIYIHIDLKKDISIFMKQCGHLMTNNKSKIVFIDKRENGIWGGFGIIKATLNLLEVASKFSYSHYMLISGSDLPIKTLDEISAFLDQNPSKSFIEYQEISNTTINYKGMDRIYGRSYNIFGKRYTYVPYFLKPKFNLKGHILNLILGSFSFYRTNKTPAVFEKFFYGSQWWTLSEEAIRYILYFLKINQDISKYFERVQLSDEIFFQTILLNNKNLKHTIINDNLRYIKWGNHDHPDILDDIKMDTFKKSKAHFARKFNIIRYVL